MVGWNGVVGDIVRSGWCECFQHDIAAHLAKDSGCSGGDMVPSGTVVFRPDSALSVLSVSATHVVVSRMSTRSLCTVVNT
jgi:hypothetical protein